MEKMNEAQLALKMIEEGKNPIDNYDIVKAAIIEGSEEDIMAFHYMIGKDLLKELEKDKDIKKKLKDFTKYMDEKIGVVKDDPVFMFNSVAAYEEWKEKKLKKYKGKVMPAKYRHIIFVREVLLPVLSDGFDSQFEYFNTKGENLLVARVTTPCNKCEGNLVYSKRKDKFFCTQCANALTKKQLKTPTNTETVESVGIDFTQLPESDLYTVSFAKTLSLMIEAHVKIEKAQWKKELKQKK